MREAMASSSSSLLRLPKGHTFCALLSLVVWLQYVSMGGGVAGEPIPVSDQKSLSSQLSTALTATEQNGTSNGKIPRKMTEGGLITALFHFGFSTLNSYAQGAKLVQELEKNGTDLSKVLQNETTINATGGEDDDDDHRTDADGNYYPSNRIEFRSEKKGTDLSNPFQSETTTIVNATGGEDEDLTDSQYFQKYRSNAKWNYNPFKPIDIRKNLRKNLTKSGAVGGVDKSANYEPRVVAASHDFGWKTTTTTPPQYKATPAAHFNSDSDHKSELDKYLDWKRSQFPSNSYPNLDFLDSYKSPSYSFGSWTSPGSSYGFGSGMGYYGSSLGGGRYTSRGGFGGSRGGMGGRRRG